jgi:hypothetical protein
MEINIRDTRRIDALLDEVHDKWFDLDKLGQEFHPGSITIPIAQRQGDLSKPGALVDSLTINHVRRIEIADTAKVGCYDINEICFDKARGCLRISCAIPAEVLVFVDELDIWYRSARDK